MYLQDIKKMTTETMIVPQLLTALSWKYGPLGRLPRKYSAKCTTVSREDQERSEREIFLLECASRPQLATPRAQLE
jgi:hypothetical protein